MFPIRHRQGRAAVQRVQANAGVRVLQQEDESAAVGALSLVKKDIPAFAIAAGVPARLIGRRSSLHRKLAADFLQERAL